MQQVEAYYFGLLLFSFLFVVLVLIILISRFFIRRAMVVPVRLFQQALQKENDGRFEEAEIVYQSALLEVNSRRFQSNKLKSTIVEKLKVLNTVIEYRKISKANN